MNAEKKTPTEEQELEEAEPKELPMLFCPACNSRLESHRCKLICRQCGYYMSCADYY